MVPASDWKYLLKQYNLYKRICWFSELQGLIKPFSSGRQGRQLHKCSQFLSVLLISAFLLPNKVLQNADQTIMLMWWIKTFLKVLLHTSLNSRCLSRHLFILFILCLTLVALNLICHKGVYVSLSHKTHDLGFVWAVSPKSFSIKFKRTKQNNSDSFAVLIKRIILKRLMHAVVNK